MADSPVGAAQIGNTAGAFGEPPQTPELINPSTLVVKGALVRVSLALAFNTPGLATGVAVAGYTPVPGDVVMQAAVRTLVTWDGVTPKIDFSFNATPGKAGVFAASGQSGPFLPNLVDQSFDGATEVTGLKQANAPTLTVNFALSEIYVATTNGKLTAWMTRDGLLGGAAVGGTKGQVILDVWMSSQAAALM